MPWDCTSCGAAALLDDEPTCTQCGGQKAAWTMHANQTRTFRTTRREKLELLRGTSDGATTSDAGYGGATFQATDRAVSIRKADALQLAREGLLPAPSQLLVARLHPRPRQDPTVHLSVLHAEAEAVTQDFPQEPLEEVGTLDVRFVLVHGPEDVADLTWEGVSIVDVTERTPQGHAPQLGASALGARRRDLPIAPWQPRGHLHALLVRPDGAVVDDAALAWERDGAAVDGPVDGVTLPAETGPEGLIRVEGLPWGTYVVRATPRGDEDGASVTLAAVALPLLRELDDEPHRQWLRFDDPAGEAEATGAPSEEEAPRGAIHARLLRPDGATLTDAALTWERDGVAMSGLPDAVGPDGVIRVDDLPWGTYVVRATPRGEGDVRLAPVALPLLREAGDEPHVQWVRFAE